LLPRTEVENQPPDHGKAAVANKTHAALVAAEGVAEIEVPGAKIRVGVIPEMTADHPKEAVVQGAVTIAVLNAVIGTIQAANALGSMRIQTEIHGGDASRQSIEAMTLALIVSGRILAQAAIVEANKVGAVL
jgi:hypothetical protein